MGNASESTQPGTLSSWLMQPFSTTMNAFEWVLFLGFALIVMVFWRQVLNEIVEAV